MEWGDLDLQATVRPSEWRSFSLTFDCETACIARQTRTVIRARSRGLGRGFCVPVVRHLPARAYLLVDGRACVEPVVGDPSPSDPVPVRISADGIADGPAADGGPCVVIEQAHVRVSGAGAAVNIEAIGCPDIAVNRHGLHLPRARGDVRCGGSMASWGSCRGARGGWGRGLGSGRGACGRG